MQASLYPLDIRQGIVPVSTTKDLTIYVDPAGDDEANGSEAHPYATWDRAFRDIPQYIEHRVRIKAGAGTYTSFPAQLRHWIGRDGILSMEGKDAPTQLAGPFTLTSVTDVGHGSVKSGLDLEVLGVGWSVDQWYGKYIRFTSGGAEGLVFAIDYNTNEVISTSGPTWYGIAAGDTFIVVEPSTKIETDRAPVFSVRSDGSPGRLISNWVLANLAFETDMDYAGPESNWEPYTFDENFNGIFGLVSFTGLNTYFSVVDQSAGIANLSGVKVHVPPLPLLEDNSLILGPYDEACGSVQILDGPTPPVAAASWYCINGSDSVERGVQMGYCVCRNGVYVDSAKAEMNHNCAGFIDVDHGSHATVDYTRIRAAGLGKNGLRVDDMSACSLQECWVDSSDLNGVILEDLSRLEIGDCGGTTANIARYGISMTIGVSARCAGTVDLEGVSGKVRLEQIDTTVDYPLAKSAETDGLGSFIIR